MSSLKHANQIDEAKLAQLRKETVEKKTKMEQILPVYEKKQEYWLSVITNCGHIHIAAMNALFSVIGNLENAYSTDAVERAKKEVEQMTDDNHKSVSFAKEMLNTLDYCFNNGLWEEVENFPWMDTQKQEDNMGVFNNLMNKEN